MSVNLRVATPADASAIHALIAGNLEIGHLLPRSLDDLRGIAGIGAAKLARYGDTLLELVRSRCASDH